MVYRVVAWCIGLALVVPSAGWAQSSSSIPVVANDRPMRFVLTSGTIVIGTRVGEDAEYWTVQTQGGLVRVRKIDVSFMDYRTNESAPTAAAPVLTPAPPPPAPAPAPPPRRRKGLLVAGISALAATYAITAGIGAIASIWDSDANWMLVPVAGPMIYYQVGDLDREVFGLLLLSTIFQGAGFVAMILGIVLYSSGREEEAVGAVGQGRGLAVAPWLGPGLGGLSMSYRM